MRKIKIVVPRVLNRYKKPFMPVAPSRVQSLASAIYAGHVPKNVPLSRSAIVQDIANQNLAGKPCAIAKVEHGKIYVKWHVFHDYR